MNINHKYLYIISFIEGGVVMAVELMGAKLLAPYFGTSLTVWAAALGVTLAGLMIGYFLGGFLSKKLLQIETLLISFLLIGGVFVIILPILARFIMSFFIEYSLQMGATLSLSLFLMPPLICMGAISPIIIKLITKDTKESGNSAGNIYAISTLGGIISTFLLGFYFLPTLGINTPALIFGLLIIAPTIIILILNQQTHIALIFIAITVIFVFISQKNKKNLSDKFFVLYESEGILGQIKVIDHSSEWFNREHRMGRGLLVNNTLQTFMDVSNPTNSSIWAWSTFIPSIISIYPKQSKVLLLGLGGGTIAKQLIHLDFEFDVVELDQRVFEVAKKYFYLDERTNVIIDDARHYINTCEKKYDIIIFDTFLSESAPEHLLTIESFQNLKKIMNPKAMFISNFYGFLNNEIGYAARSVNKTIVAAGFISKIVATPGEEENRNLLFLGLTEEKDFTKLTYSELGVSPIKDINPYIISDYKFNKNDAEILTDKKPKLSLLYSKASMSWKKAYNSYYTKGFINEGIN